MDNSGQVSSGSSQNFVQQGSVDWVSLSKSTVTLSLEVFARLSRAGIEPITIGMGRAICKDIPMKAEAQKRLNEVLSRLKSFASYNKIIYFGFGVRHILHDLRDSETGSACIALCACLMTNYDSWHAAQVLRELCLVKGAPTDLVPSLSQWEALLNTCAGVMGASCRFPHMVEIFARHLRLRNESPVSIHQPASPGDLATCLSTLLDVASGKIARVNFTGGQEGSVDCAWIAAVSEWLLCLTVEIYTTSPSNPRELICGYQSPSLKRGEAQVIVTPGDVHANSVVVKSTTYVLSALCVNFGTGSGTTFTRHSPWSSILRDSFGSTAQVLIDFDFRVGSSGDLANKSLAMPFAELLGQIAIHWDPSFNSISDNTLGEFQESAEVFRAFATIQFPELGPVLDASRSIKPDPNVSENQAWKKFVALITESCRCASCKSILFGSRTFDLCAVRVASTIVDILRTLYRTEVDEEVLPSPTGFLQLYRRTNVGNLFGESKIPRRTFNHANSASNFSASLTEIMSLFGGTISGGALFGSEPLQRTKDVAKSSQGMCAYYKILEQLELPLAQADKVRVVHGCLWLHGQIYTTGAETGVFTSTKTKLVDFLAVINNDLPIRFTATESRTPKLLELNYEALYGDKWVNLSWSHVLQMVPSLRGVKSGGCTHSDNKSHSNHSTKSNPTSSMPSQRIETHFNIRLRENNSSISLTTQYPHINPGTWLFLFSYSSINANTTFTSQSLFSSQTSSLFNSQPLFSTQTPSLFNNQPLFGKQSSSLFNSQPLSGNQSSSVLNNQSLFSTQTPSLFNNQPLFGNQPSSLFNSRLLPATQPSSTLNSQPAAGSQPLSNQGDNREKSRIGVQIQPSCFAQLYAKASLFWELDLGGLFGFPDARVGREYTGCCILCAIRAFELELSFSAPNPQWRKLALGKSFSWGKLHLLGPSSYSTNVELVPDDITESVEQNPGQNSPRTNKRKRRFESFVSDESEDDAHRLDEEGTNLATVDFDEDIIRMVVLQTGATHEVATASLTENNGDAVLSILKILRSSPE